MRVLRLHIPIFLLLAIGLFNGCELDSCRNVVCAKNGVCVDGYCDCLGPYVGEDCELETPFSFTLSRNEVSAFRGYQQTIKVKITDIGIESPMVNFKFEKSPSGFQFELGKKSFQTGETSIDISPSDDVEDGVYKVDVVGTTDGGSRCVQTLTISVGKEIYNAELTVQDSFFVTSGDEEWTTFGIYLIQSSGPKHPISFTLLDAPEDTVSLFAPFNPDSDSLFVMKLRTSAQVGVYPCRIVAEFPSSEIRILSFVLSVSSNTDCREMIVNKSGTLNLSCSSNSLQNKIISGLLEEYNDTDVFEYQTGIKLFSPYGEGSESIKAYLDCENQTVAIPKQLAFGPSVTRTYYGSGFFNENKSELRVTYTVETPIFGGMEMDQCTAVYSKL
ncbi:hypothetical protein N8911_01465 [bacterium]|nr:hypothetical protein [bacterium]